MSKYIKLEDAISKIVNTPTRVITDDLPALADRQHEIIDMLADLPTIEVSEDCISREYLKSFGYINKGNFNSVETIREWIDNAPNVIPKEKVGEWIYCEDDEGQDGYRCSECGFFVPWYYDYEDSNYILDYKACPHCLAKMKGADNE